MDRPFQERQFTYSGRNYLLPASSKLEKLLYARPEDLESRFFEHGQNHTQIAREEKKSILTTAFIHYLAYAEKHRLLDTFQKDVLFKKVERRLLSPGSMLLTQLQWRSDPHWKRQNESGKLRNTSIPNHDRVGSELAKMPATRTGLNGLTACSSWNCSTAGPMPARPSSNLATWPGQMGQTSCPTFASAVPTTTPKARTLFSYGDQASDQVEPNMTTDRRFPGLTFRGYGPTKA